MTLILDSYNERTDNITREQWFLDRISYITEQIFAPADVIVPQIEVSTNKPGGKTKAWTIDASNSADQETYHIFISSEVLEKSTLIDLLFGELVYCIAGRRPTKAFRRTFSLTRAGKRWYPEVGSETAAKLSGVVAWAPDYPHVPVIVEEKDKKQSSRMLKIQCAAHDKPIILRGSRESFTTGFPVCSCGNTFTPDGWIVENETNEITQDPPDNPDAN